MPTTHNEARESLKDWEFIKTRWHGANQPMEAFDIFGVTEGEFYADDMRKLATKVWSELGAQGIPVNVSYTCSGDVFVSHASMELNKIERRNLQVLSRSILQRACTLRPDGGGQPDDPCHFCVQELGRK